MIAILLETSFWIIDLEIEVVCIEFGRLYQLHAIAKVKYTT